VLADVCMRSQADAAQGWRGGQPGQTHFREGALGEDTADDALAGARAEATRGGSRDGRGKHSHEQTSLSTGAVADDDELSTNLRHGVGFGGGGSGSGSVSVWGLQRQKSVDKGRWQRLGWVVEVEVVSESDSLQEAKTVRARTTHHAPRTGARGPAAVLLVPCSGVALVGARGRQEWLVHCNAMQCTQRSERGGMDWMVDASR
jgi:hypothetical protein